VQEQITKRRIEEGARLVGRKDRPDRCVRTGPIGRLAARLRHGVPRHGVANGSEIAPGKLIQPKVEGEIAFILGRDLTDEKLTTADVLTAIAWAVPALKIVDSRIEAWNIRIMTYGGHCHSGPTSLPADAGPESSKKFFEPPSQRLFAHHLACHMAMAMPPDTTAVTVGSAH
jgi:hypothetical protein